MDFRFKPKVIAEAESKYSGKIRVVQGWGFKHLSTDVIQHSGGIVEEIWDTAMKGHVKNKSSWLMLGVAGGVVLKLISRKYKPEKMTGIEIDPVIIDLGRKYFDLNKIKNLEIVITDAKEFVHKTREKWDYVCCDLFGGESPPPFIYTDKFLKRLKELGNRVFINHLFNNEVNIQKLESLINQIEGMGYKVKRKRVMKNMVIWY